MHLTGLARVARDAGLTVREVPGWKTRTAHRGGMNKVIGVTWHHTATPAASVVGRNNPTTQYMTSGLGYPLANYGLAWDGSVDVIAAGTGAHAGKGSYRGIPNNDGNRHMIGVEVEGTIGLEWSDAQLEAAARLGAQLNKDFGTDLLHIAHYEWAPGRKTDPTGIPGNMPALRAAINRGHWATISPAASKTETATIAPAPLIEEDPLAAYNDDTLAALIRESVSTISIPTTRGNRHLTTILQNVDADFGRVKGNQAALEDMVGQLATAQGVEIDYDRIKRIVDESLVESTVTVDVNVKGN